MSRVSNSNGTIITVTVTATTSGAVAVNPFSPPPASWTAVGDVGEVINGGGAFAPDSSRPPPTPYPWYANPKDVCQGFEDIALAVQGKTRDKQTQREHRLSPPPPPHVHD